MTTNATISKFARGLLLHALLGLPVAVIAAEEPTEERFIPNYAAGDAYYLWSTRTDLEAAVSSRPSSARPWVFTIRGTLARTGSCRR